MTIDLNAIGATLINMGLPGIVILALAWVCWQMRKEGRADLAALQAKYDDLQEKRVAEGRESLNALNNTTNVLDDVLKAIQAQGANK